MTELTTLIPFYESLLKSVGNYYDKQKAAANDTIESYSFAHNILRTEPKVAEFKQVITEFTQHLDDYDFQNRFRYDEFNRIIESLLYLRPKLKEMSEEAKKLEPYPDRFGSKRAIKICNNLVFKIKEKLGLNEIEKATTLVETNTQALISIRQQIDMEEREELKRILASVKNRQPDMWRDVAEKFEARITALLESDKKCISSDIEILKKEIENSSDNKKADVLKMLKEYPWLQKERYASDHTGWVSGRYLTFSEYQALFEEKRDDRKKHIIKIVFISIVGGGILILCTIGTIVGLL
ncbi:MAG: hypothetical protein IKM85_00565 [Bacteroidales bacterium]|nr:hypothetical protein [Bacteroidales bacterium]